jgi:hypothetical protein
MAIGRLGRLKGGCFEDQAVLCPRFALKPAQSQKVDLELREPLAE